jgi:hypothetical protein
MAAPSKTENGPGSSPPRRERNVKKYPDSEKLNPTKSGLTVMTV